VHETRLWAYGTSLAMIALIALMLFLMASAHAAEPTYAGTAKIRAFLYGKLIPPILTNCYC
jgi:hypothetical protein